MAFLIDESIALSILDANFISLKSTLPYLIDLGIKNIHFDIMDGSFVPNISFGAKITKSIMALIGERIIDSSAHLMVCDSHKHMSSFFNSGVERVVVHIEDLATIDFLLKSLNKDNGKENNSFGISVKPETKISKIPLKLLKHCKEVLVMTVNPGKGGQSMIVDCLNKTKELKKIRDLHKLNFIITIDGGVNEKTIQQVNSYPIDQFVVGSTIWKSLQTAREKIEFIQEAILQGRALRI